MPEECHNCNERDCHRNKIFVTGWIVHDLKFGITEKSKRPISNHKGLVSMKNVRDKNHEYLIGIDYTHLIQL